MRLRSPKRIAFERVLEIARITAGDAVKDDRILRHYRAFIEPGDLVFDLGANVGERTETFRRLGAHVVAVDPQPSSVAALEARFSGEPHVTVVGKAAAASPGTYTLRVDENTTLSTLSPDWIDAVKESGRFEAEWRGSVEVEGTTLDALIDEFGLPQFCKIDVEGYEPEVISGLSRPLPSASFEFAAEAIERVIPCVERFAALGPCEFSVAYGEEMIPGRWEPAERVIPRLRAFPDELTWGDIYVRSRDTAAEAIARTR
jgi:FkbM family methyltransferase